MTRALRTVLDGLAFGEAPRWRDGRLYFSDMHAHEVVAVTPDGARETIVTSPTAVSGLGWLPDGRMLVVSMDDRKLMRLEADGRLAEHADLSDIATFHPNDMVVDAQGRAYVGNFGFPLYPRGETKAAKLARVDPDGAVHEAADGLIFPNGAVISPDGKTLVVGETFAGRMTAFDVAPDGGLSNRRVWAALPQGAVPDGCCLDAEGAIWVASPTTNDVIRLHEGGEVSERIDTGRGAFACMLGGDDRRTLFMLIADGSDPEKSARTRTASIVATEVNVPGAGLP
ncbi:MAG TPA: SMP-30/gluconolactonase/LRE family protein [Caulobacteraceae bacterium]|jgi:sugar lactone lactonase YvrE|nr:SMP-30/gluconolactonase/LRE family protein [Caulobacteraceae bacterium]